MHLDLYISGTGGQGIQLASRTLGIAAMASQYKVMLASEYGGEMRGGSSRASLVITDQEMRALPVLPSAGSAIAMHHLFWQATASRLRPGALVVADAAVIDDIPVAPDWKLITVPAARIAVESGNLMTASMAMLGAFAAISRVVSADALVEAMESLLPARRRQHAVANEKAIRAGFDHSLSHHLSETGAL